MMMLFELTVTNCMEIKETYTSWPALNYAILKRREMYRDVTISFFYTVTLSYIVKKCLKMSIDLRLQLSIDYYYYYYCFISIYAHVL